MFFKILLGLLILEYMVLLLAIISAILSYQTAKPIHEKISTVSSIVVVIFSALSLFLGQSGFAIPALMVAILTFKLGRKGNYRLRRKSFAYRYTGKNKVL